MMIFRLSRLVNLKANPESDTPLQSPIAKQNPREAAPGLALRVARTRAQRATETPQPRLKAHGAWLCKEAA